MKEEKLNNVRFIRRSSTKFFIPRQIVNGVKIPELTVYVSETSKDLNADNAIFLVTENFAFNTTYFKNGRSTLTNTGVFLQKAYDTNLSGEINFTDIGQNPVKELFGFDDSSPNTAGNFTVDRFDGKNIIDTIGADFYYNIDVPNFQSQIDNQRNLFETYRNELLNGNAVSGESGISLSTINLGIALLATNSFTELTGHELGGHGNRFDLSHNPYLSSQGYFGYSRDFAYNAGAEDAYNTGAIFAGPNGIVGAYRQGEEGYNSLTGFKIALFSGNPATGNGNDFGLSGTIAKYRSDSTNTFDENSNPVLLLQQNVRTPFSRLAPGEQFFDPVTGNPLPSGFFATRDLFTGRISVLMQQIVQI